jgi:hypothetical protein
MGLGPMFDIFSRLPDGSPLWLESVEGLEEARKRLDGLARVRPGKYFLYSEKTGGVVGRVPSDEEGGDKAPARYQGIL